MLRRSTKIQLVLFVIITLVGISYVSAEYVGLAKYVVGDNGCTVSAEFQNSGGIFTNAEVTYRGVTVGKVGTLHLLGRSSEFPYGGVRADLELDDCGSPKIPADTTANVANRSVVGEQYVNLVPPATTTASYTGPYLKKNAVISSKNNTVPTPTYQLLKDIDDLVTSVPLGDLRTTITELNNAVSGRGPALGNLLDATNSLLKTANQSDNLSATLNLIQDSATVLQTQLDVNQPLQSWTRSLNLLSQQLRKSDPDIRRLLDDGPMDLATVSRFITTNQPDLSATLANLITVGNLLVTHLGGIEEIFELYPALAAGGQSVLHDNKGALALVLQTTPMPQDCGDPTKDGQGYNGTARRLPGQVSPIAPNVTVRCTAPASSGTNVRGSANVPGGDPISLSGGGYVYPRVVTSNLKPSTAGKKMTVAQKAKAGTLLIGPAVSENSVVNHGAYVTLLTSSLG